MKRSEEVPLEVCRSVREMGLSRSPSPSGSLSRRCLSLSKWFG